MSRSAIDHTLAREGETLPFTPDAAASDERCQEVVYDWNLVTDEIVWGANLQAVLGLGSDVLLTGRAYADHLVPGSPSSRYEAIVATDGCDTGGGVPFSAVYGLVSEQRASGPPVWVEDCGRWFADASDRPGRAHGIIRVITERYEAERLLVASARLDDQTGTFTRAYFIEQLARQLSLNQRSPTTFAVLLIGLSTRTALGESASPSPTGEGLKPVMEHLRRHMRAHEILAHYAGAKFAVLLENCNASQAASAAERFIDTIAAVPRGGAVLDARIGAVISPGHGRTPQAILQFAEEALDAARQPTSPPFMRYEPDQLRRRRAPMQASDEILAALNEGRVVIALQPVVDATTRVPAFHEALVRIRRLNGSLIMPDALVPDAERNGLVSLLDRRVVELAFARLTADRTLALSINAAVASLYDSCWVDHLRASCKLRPDAARRLTIEITETGVISDMAAARLALATIKPLGVKIAIDDFGSGHSSFRNLRDLPIDYLKIDGAFAQNLASSADDRFFIRTLIDLARNLQIPTVAEWVEDEATAQLLRNWGVDYLQGHLFGRAEIAPDA